MLPPTLDELVPTDHPARFVAEFVDALDRSSWTEMGIDLEGEALGAPGYHPRALLSVWIYGFMTGVRSSRKLEGACRDQIPYLWLTGWQHPDHNTLWRFYRTHRLAMRKLLKQTVRTSVKMGLVDLALQAVDGTKIAANAAKDRTHDRAGLEKVLERTEAAILELEAQNEGGGDEDVVRLPGELTQKEALRKQVREAMDQLEDGRERINLTDEDAVLMKGRQGIVVGYNAQAMASPLDADKTEVSGFLITAADVTDDPDDHSQLMPMIEKALEMTGERAQLTAADGGYHSGANLEQCEQHKVRVVMPESQSLTNPYHKDNFSYDPQTDSFMCPQAHSLEFRGIKHRSDRFSTRVYRANAQVCRVCPAFGICTQDSRQGRAVETGPHENILRRHRAWMATEEAKAAYKQRKQLVEPVFGVVKEQQGARRFLLRGLGNVRSEWALLATAFNLRTLCRVWRIGKPSGRLMPWPFSAAV